MKGFRLGVSEFQNADGPYLQPLYSGIERLRAHEHETANVQNLLSGIGFVFCFHALQSSKKHTQEQNDCVELGGNEFKTSAKRTLGLPFPEQCKLLAPFHNRCLCTSKAQGSFSDLQPADAYTHTHMRTCRITFAPKVPSEADGGPEKRVEYGV